MRTDTRPSRKSGGDGQPPAREPRRGPSAAERVLHGLAVSPGIGIGRLATATESTPRKKHKD